MATKTKEVAATESRWSHKSYGFVFRVWRNEKGFPFQYDECQKARVPRDWHFMYDHTDLDAIAKEWFNMNMPFCDTGPDLNYIIEKILACPRISALEVCDENGRGVVFYPEWP